MESVAPHKIETAQLDTNDRRWILGLTGPWGDSSSIYIRVIFLFPPSYPSEEGVHPKVLFEKHPLISLKRRVWMISQLDNRRKRKRPVASCLRFLLGMPDENSKSAQLTDPAKGHGAGQLSARLRDLAVDADASEMEDTEDKGVVHNTQETPVLKTSQAIFGPNGRSTCYQAAQVLTRSLI